MPNVLGIFANFPGNSGKNFIATLEEPQSNKCSRVQKVRNCEVSDVIFEEYDQCHFLVIRHPRHLWHFQAFSTRR